LAARARRSRGVSLSPGRAPGPPVAEGGAGGLVTKSARRDWTRETLADGVRAGDKRALARAISLVENRDALAYDVVHDLYPDTGNAYAVGLTGPPGVGKSSLISTLVRHVRASDTSVGVVSVRSEERRVGKEGRARGAPGA